MSTVVIQSICTYKDEAQTLEYVSTQTRTRQRNYIDTNTDTAVHVDIDRSRRTETVRNRDTEGQREAVGLRCTVTRRGKGGEITEGEHRKAQGERTEKGSDTETSRQRHRVKEREDEDSLRTGWCPHAQCWVGARPVGDQC